VETRKQVDLKINQKIKNQLSLWQQRNQESEQFWNHIQKTPDYQLEFQFGPPKE
jgi:hypothetical protein